jgi:hypothetical protein
MALGAALIISRRPDAVTHAQFWAEDGEIYFANVYNHGLRATLTVPQAGYFQTFPLLAARFAQLVALAQAPLITNLLALLAQVLPVGLLLSPRATSISPDLRVRGLLACLYIIVPGVMELDATAVNAQWNLAFSALIVLLLAPPRHARWRCLDGLILLLTGLTGPFCLLLAPVALVQRRLRGSAVIPLWELGLLVACAILQLVSLLVISHEQFQGMIVEPRPHPGLGATPSLFAKLVGGRLLLGTILGPAAGLAAPLGLQWLALAVGLISVALAARFAQTELRLMTAFGIVLLAASLWDPSTPTPAWPTLALSGIGGQRYFFIPELAALALLVWMTRGRWPAIVRIVACALIAASVVIAIAGHWSYPPFASTGFPAKAAAFGRAPRGTVVTFALNPASWTMTLTKR